MRSVNQATQDAWNTISYTSKRIYRTATSSNIPDVNITSIKFSEAISDSESLFFVGCISTKVDIVLNNFTTDISDETIEIYVQKEDTTELKVFTGKVFECDTNKKDGSMSLVCYDALYEIFNADVSTWYENLSLPMSFSSFRDSFFNHFGITQKATTLIFDSQNIERTVGGEILGADIIKPLCEANVVLGHINYDGEFEYIFPTANTRTVAIGEISSLVKEDYTTSLIDKVIVRADENDIGAVAGVGSNAYIVEGNIFFLGLSAADLLTVATTILDAIDDISFQPMESEQMYNPIYELGDLITLTDGANTYTTIILKRETDFIRENVTAKGLVEYSRAASYSNNSLIALMGKTNRLYRDVEQTKSEITDVAAGLHSEITQTAEGLQIQIQDLQEQIDGETAYYERESGAPTLLNYPYWDFCSAFKCDGTKVCDAIYNENMTDGGDQYPHFYYSEQDRKDHRSDLCYVDDTNLAYRFVLENGVWYWKEIADSDYTQILSRLATLEATAEQLTSEYTEISATVTTQGIAINTHTSQLSQTATQISSLVSTTTSQGNRLTTAESKITQNANSITSLVTTTNNLSGTVSTHTSQITQMSTQISAKVSQTGGSQQSFGWNLTSSGFDLYSGNTRVLRCDSTGLTVTGSITSSSTISGATISGASISGGSITGAQINGGTITGQITVGNGATFSRMDCNNLSVGGRNYTHDSFSTQTESVLTGLQLQYSSAAGGYVIVGNPQYKSITFVKQPTLRGFLGTTY